MKTKDIITAIRDADPAQLTLPLGKLTVTRAPRMAWGDLAATVAKAARRRPDPLTAAPTGYTAEGWLHKCASDAMALYGSEMVAADTIRRQVDACRDLDPDVAKRALRLADWFDKPHVATREVINYSRRVPVTVRGREQIMWQDFTSHYWSIDGPRIAWLFSQIHPDVRYLSGKTLTIDTDEELETLKLKYNITIATP